MEILAEVGTLEWARQIQGALARGYAADKNTGKQIDPYLISAMAKEVQTLLRTDVQPRLGCATTRQLIEELTARLDINMDYRTIDGH